MKFRSLTTVLVVCCIVVLSLFAQAQDGGAVAVPTFRLFFVRLQTGQENVIEGQIEFNDHGSSAFDVTLTYDSNYLIVYDVTVDGFDTNFNIPENQGTVNIIGRVVQGVETRGESFKIQIKVVARNTGETRIQVSNPQVLGVAGEILPQVAFSESIVLIESAQPPTPIPAIPQPVRVTIAVSSANLRSGPGLCHKVVAFGYQDEEYPVLSYVVRGNNYWYKIEREDQTWAWVASSVVLFRGTFDLLREEPDLPQPILCPNPTPIPQSTTSGNGENNNNGSNNNNGNEGSNNNNGSGSNSPQPTLPASDSDGDGFHDGVDRCPTEPPLGWQGGGDCPDNDADGVVNPLDACPTQYGTYNGCPDSDNDGTPDTSDACPYAAGPSENNGCPI